MVGEEEKKKLYDYATKGEVANFVSLLQEDPYLLDNVSFPCTGNLLHIATICRQEGIVKEVLKTNPRLATSLDPKNSSPLHIAAAEGSLEIAKILLSIAPEACWWRDCHDMNPVHIAAMNGHVEILELLLQESPLPAIERVHRGQTVWHLCLKHGQLQALKALVRTSRDLARAADDDGETLLHLAVRSGQLEAIQYLVEVTGLIKKDAQNSMGKTALAILNEIPGDTISNYSEIQGILQNLSRPPVMESMKLSEITLVVVVLIATMAFQIAVNPPGGLWQDNTSSHNAGGSIMKSNNSRLYGSVRYSSTAALAASLVTIFLIISGLSSRHFLSLWFALVAMWVSVTSIASCCVVSMLFISNPTRTPSAYLWVMDLAIYAAGIVPMYYIYRKDFK